ncbi:hypothetical protein ACEYYH_01350 [Microbacterium trichothecenolyticum]
MDAVTLDELRTLRARAHGPSADIDQDPAALQFVFDGSRIGVFLAAGDS